MPRDATPAGNGNEGIDLRRISVVAQKARGFLLGLLKCSVGFQSAL
jgi:hypothetical protein